MYNQYAFVAESGNDSFDFEEALTSDYFVVTVILIAKEDIEPIKGKLKELPLEVILGTILLEDRIKWYDALLSLEYKVYTIVIDKKKLHVEGGHGNMGTSFEHVNKMLYDDLFTETAYIAVHADDRVTPFMEFFRNYTQERQQPSLFDSSVFSYKNANEERCLQLAELISELIFAAYEYKQPMVEQLADKIIRLENYPIFTFQFESDHPLDNMIATHVIQIAQSYIKEHETSEVQVVIDRLNFLKYLLIQLTSNPNMYSYSQKVIDNLKAFSKEKISKDYLMSDIIGPLRDAGVLIASTSKGYKLPTSGKDLTDYVEFSSSKALPMLRRMGRSRQRVLEMTNGEFDIIEEDHFAELRDFFKEK